MTLEALLARARGATHQEPRIYYMLGRGGKDPLAPHPGEQAGMGLFCDCSGYVCWVLGIGRQSTDPLYLSVTAGGWVNTDAMAFDAQHGGGMLDRIPLPEPGCLILYPRGAMTQAGVTRKIGHVGIVAAVGPLRVLHCSKGNDRAFNHAIAETDGNVFDVDLRIYARIRSLTDGRQLA